MKHWDVGILLFNDVEVLDFAGPFEVFSITTALNSNKRVFTVKTIAQEKEVIRARNGLKIVPDYDFNDSVSFDILIIPGGYGAKEVERHNLSLINWIKEKGLQTDMILSVCTGAFLLAETGLLNGKQATTHWMAIDRFEKEFDQIEVKREATYVDEQTIITSGGVSSGIDTSLYVVKKLLGEEVADTTAKRMVYDININEL